MTQPKVLFVLTSHNKLGDTGKPTGWYLVFKPRLQLEATKRILRDISRNLHTLMKYLLPAAKSPLHRQPAEKHRWTLRQ